MLILLLEILGKIGIAVVGLGMSSQFFGLIFFFPPRLNVGIELINFDQTQNPQFEALIFSYTEQMESCIDEVRGP